MIYTVTLNPSLDYVISVDDLRPGSVNRTAKERIFCGGKGINVSIVLKHLGVESVALGFAAGFTGDEIIRRLEEEGVRTDFVRALDGISRINVKLRAGEETEINGRGPRLTAEEAAAWMRRLERLQDGDVLVLSGSVPQGLSDGVYEDVMKALRHKDLKIAVDATGDLLVRTLPYGPFLIKPNRAELEEIFGVSIRTEKEVAAYAKKLQDKGAKNVLVSMAGDGAVLVSADGQVFSSRPPQGRVVNSVGAGDSMVAGFLAGHAASGDYREAFLTGLCAGSATAFSEGLAKRDEVERLLAQMKTS